MFGIDVSAGQVGMDYARARAEGVEFVIVKAVAAFRPEHTVADGYHANMDAVIAAGIPGRGHYLVVNSRNTPEQSADFMAAHLYRYERSHSLNLDNEPLDTYKTFWRDAECARFFRRLHDITGAAYPMMWLYCPASLTRQNAPWPECEALGVRFWWAAYGGGPSGHTPDHAPALNGSLSHWDVHQYTSNAAVAGRSVDGNSTPHPMTELFPAGGAMSNYANVDNFRVIQADQRDPNISWASHRSRQPASLGGVDLVAPSGTPIHAPGACTIRNLPNNGSGGNTVEMRFPDGWTDQMMHLSRFVGEGSKRQGDLIGYSGTSGGVAPHVHWHRIGAFYRDQWGSTNRYNPFNYFADQPGPSPEPPKRDEDMMIRIQSTNRGIALVGAGYFRGLTSDEEVQQSGPLISAHYTGNDRQFDVWVSEAYGGNAAFGNLDKPTYDAVLSLEGGGGDGGGGEPAPTEFAITLTGKAVAP